MAAKKKPRKRVAPSKATASGSATSSVERRSGGEVVDESTSGERLAPQEVGNDPAMVHASGAFTKNLGNYESAKVSVSVSRPCKNDEESIESTYQWCLDFVNQKIDQEIQEIE